MPIKFIVYTNNHHATLTLAFPLPSGGKPLIQYIHGLYYYEQHPTQFAFLGQVPAITQDVYTGLLMLIYFIMKLLKNVTYIYTICFLCFKVIHPRSFIFIIKIIKFFSICIFCIFKIGFHIFVIKNLKFYIRRYVANFTITLN